MADVFTHKAAITELYTDEAGCYIKLGVAPFLVKDGLFQLKKGHANYESLYALALSAAMNGMELRIRTAERLDKTKPAVVVYLKVDFGS